MPKKKRENKGKFNQSQRRPQPAGWGSSVKTLLKPEHVERLSDTQVRITLPECPDYDIDEDETINVTIPASALEKSTEPLNAGSFTIRANTYEERIDYAIQALKEEQACLGENTAVPSFIFTFFTCEIVAKSIVSKCKFKGTNRKSLTDKWSTKEINKAISELKIDFDEASVKALFSEEKVVASQMSARALRDNIVHRMKPVHRNAVKQRYNPLMSTMQKFLSAVDAWRETTHHNIDASGK